MEAFWNTFALLATFVFSTMMYHSVMPHKRPPAATEGDVDTANVVVVELEGKVPTSQLGVKTE